MEGGEGIQGNLSPEWAARNACDSNCDYLDILNKRIHIQQRALACQGKALSHMLQRDLYVMGSTDRIRRDMEMAQLDLGETRCQELRKFPFPYSSLLHSQLVEEKKAP